MKVKVVTRRGWRRTFRNVVDFAVDLEIGSVKIVQEDAVVMLPAASVESITLPRSVE